MKLCYDEEKYKGAIYEGCYFSWNEALFSPTAMQLGIDNSPPDEKTVANITNTAKHLNPIRIKHGPIYVSSWLRAPKLNHAVGGQPTSQHMSGEAGDIMPYYLRTKLERWEECYAFWKLLKDDKDIEYDQLILEYPSADKKGQCWVHISFSNNPAKPNRRQAFLLDKHSGKVSYG